MVGTTQGAGGTSFTDGGVTPGQTYSYFVYARDAAGHTSAPASLSVSTTPPPPADAAPDQYIPPEWQSYFYDQLTAGLRQRDVMTGLNPPPARGWLDPGADAVFVGTAGDAAANGLQVATGVAFLDRNGNGQYDAGETAWVAAAQGSAYQPGDALLAGAAPPAGTPGVTGVYYQDLNHNGRLDPGEALLRNVNTIQGVAGQLAYRDLGGVGHWVAADPIWYDANKDSRFDAGDPVLYAGSAAPQPGDLGKKQGLCFYDAAGTGTWQPSDTLVWVDQSTFRQDFAAFYPALEQLVPKFGRPGAAYPDDLQDVGSLLQSLGAQPQTYNNDTISINPNTYGGVDVNTSGASFFNDFKPGDNIQINGGWYPVTSWDPDAGWDPDTGLLVLGKQYKGPAVTVRRSRSSTGRSSRPPITCRASRASASPTSEAGRRPRAWSSPSSSRSWRACWTR